MEKETTVTESLDMEDVLMSLISASGSAHACAIESIRKARTGDFAGADETIAEGEESLRTATDLHFSLLKRDMRDPDAIKITLLLTHAQDHLMNAQTSFNLAKEIVEICKTVIKQSNSEGGSL